MKEWVKEKIERFVTFVLIETVIKRDIDIFKILVFVRVVIPIVVGLSIAGLIWWLI